MHPNTVQAICWGAAARARWAYRWWCSDGCAALAGNPAGMTAQAASMAADKALNLTARLYGAKEPLPE